MDFLTELSRFYKTSTNKFFTLSKASVLANPSDDKDNKALTIDPSVFLLILS